MGRPRQYAEAMRYAVVADGARLRWIEWAGPRDRPARVFLHGLGGAGAAHLAEVAAHPDLPAARTLVPDLLGHGLSDRPAHFGYTLADHAAALAAALDRAEVRGADIVGHSMGGAVALVLAYRRLDLVGRLVLSEPNLDPWDGVLSPSIARQSEHEFVTAGFARLVKDQPPERAAVLRLAGPLALYRSAAGLCAGSVPMMREILLRLPIAVALLWGDRSRPLAYPEQIRAAGISVVTVPDSSHSIPADNPQRFAREVAELLDRDRTYQRPAR
jgi:pimeloyl-ACP methyl ester carboxylesterase